MTARNRIKERGHSCPLAREEKFRGLESPRQWMLTSLKRLVADGESVWTGRSNNCKNQVNVFLQNRLSYGLCAAVSRTETEHLLELPGELINVVVSGLFGDAAD